MILTAQDLKKIIGSKSVGIVELLNRLQQGQFGLLRENIEHITSVKSVVFHGSPSKATILKPSKSTGMNGIENQSRVYATDDPNYAIFLACIRLHNASAGVVAKKGETILTVDTSFVNGRSRLTSGYVHVLDAHFFNTRLGNREVASKESVPVLFSIQVSPADLTVPIYIQTS